MISLISGNIFMKSYSLKTVLKGGEWKTRRVFDFLFLGECASRDETGSCKRRRATRERRRREGGKKEEKDRR